LNSNQNTGQIFKKRRVAFCTVNDVINSAPHFYQMNAEERIKNVLEDPVQKALQMFENIHRKDPLNVMLNHHKLIEKYARDLLNTEHLPIPLLLACNAKHVNFHKWHIPDKNSHTSLKEFKLWRARCCKGSIIDAIEVLNKCNASKDLKRKVQYLLLSEHGISLLGNISVKKKWIKCLNDASVMAFLTVKLRAFESKAETNSVFIIRVLEYAWPMLSRNGLELCKKIGLEKLMTDILFRLT
jgi:hypothetical protein